MILKDNGMIDALKIIKNEGFVDTTPDISLCTSKIFEREGKKFKFNGWYRMHNRSWSDIEMIEYQ